MLDKQEVEHIANLSRLGLSEKEKQDFGQKMSKILDYVKQLQKVDTKKIEPIAQITNLENVEREDKVRQKDYKEKLLKLTPGRENDYFKVKTIF